MGRRELQKVKADFKILLKSLRLLEG